MTKCTHYKKHRCTVSYISLGLRFAFHIASASCIRLQRMQVYLFGLFLTTNERQVNWIRSTKLLKSVCKASSLGGGGGIM